MPMSTLVYGLPWLRVLTTIGQQYARHLALWLKMAGALCTSDAVWLEVLVRPLRLKQEIIAGCYRALLDTNRILSIPETVFADALSITTHEGLKAMDAVHVAIAAHHRCGRFVTTDPHFKSLETVTPEWIQLPAD